MPKRVAILLLNWNAYDYTSKCLDTLNTCDRSLFDAIIIDNNSSDGSSDRLEKKYSWTIILRNPVNGGFTGGNNVGIRYALEKDYEFIMLLNNDTEVESNFLKPLLARMDEHPDFAAVQPKIYYNHDRNLLWNAGGILRKGISKPVTIGDGATDHPKFDQSRSVDWITACCIMTRSELVRKVGPQNEIFFYGSYDDVDWSLRLTDGGKFQLFYEPGSVIYHDAGVAGKGDMPGKEGFMKPFVHYLTQRNNLFFIRLHTSVWMMPTTIMYQLGVSVAVLAYFILRRRFKKLRAAFFGMIDGLRLPLDQKIDHVAAIKKYNS